MFSDYIIYVDESGDHNLEVVDPFYPVFVLGCCLLRKADYINVVSPAIQALKFKHWGHDMVILHAHEIRKSTGDFTFLLNPTLRPHFMADVNQLMLEAPFTLVASVIKKEQLKKHTAQPDNPYNIALQLCLEQATMLLEAQGQIGITHVVVESRGIQEDRALELTFLRLCNGQNTLKKPLPFAVVFADKKRNSGGLQLADLVVHPIGRHVINPNQPNRPYEIIRPKLSNGVRVFP
jgi:hypothetical protein